MGREAIAVLGLGLVLLVAAAPAGASHVGLRAPPVDPVAAPVPAGPTPSSNGQPGTSGARGELSVSTLDPAAMPNQGLQTNLTAFATTPLPADTSFQVAASETIGGFDAVFGIFENEAQLPVAFFSVFTNSSDTLVHQVYWSGLLLYPGEPYDFQLVPVNATDWELSVNGAEFGGNNSSAYFDFGTDAATWLAGLLFSEVTFYATTSPVPVLLNVPLAFAVREGGAWYLPTSSSTSFSGAGGSPWGVEGRIQHPTLAPGEINTGTSVAALPDNTSLWTGGPVPVRVGLTLSALSGVGTTPFFLDVVVDDTSGAPVPGASLFVGDSLGGSSLVTLLVTNGSGGAEDALLLPNVSADTPDLIQAVVTSFGYSGSSGASVEVTPPIQLFIAIHGLPGAIAPAAVASFMVTVTDAAGAPVGGASLDLTVVASGGQITPASAVTYPNGTLDVEVVAAAVPTVMVIDVNVTADGAWGHASVNLTVAIPPPSFGAQYGGEIELGVGLAIVAALVVIVLARFRGRRPRPLPPSHGIRWGEPSIGPSGDSDAPPTTRTPPSAGTP